MNRVIAVALGVFIGMWAFAITAFLAATLLFGWAVNQPNDEPRPGSLEYCSEKHPKDAAAFLDCVD